MHVNISNHDVNPNENELGRKLDEVVDEIDFGWYQLRLLFVVGMAMASDSMEIGFLVLIQTCIEEELNLTDLEGSWLAGSVLIGQIVGLLTFGPVADIYGRRISVLVGWGMIIAFGLLSCLSVNYAMLVVLRGLVGIGIGASQTVAYDLFAETVPTKYRSRLIYLSFFSIFGGVYTIGMCAALLVNYGWRWLAFAIAVPILLAGIAGYFWIVESPRWLLSKGRIRDAEEALEMIASINNSFNADSDQSNSNSNVENEDNEKSKVNEKFRLVRDDSLSEEQSFFKGLETLWSDSNLWWTSVSLWIIWILVSFSYFYVAIVLLLIFAGSAACTFDYGFLILATVVDLVGTGIALVNVDFIGRSPSQFVGFLGGACIGTAFAEYYNADLHIGTVTLLFLTRISISSGVPVLWMHTAELFPTELRASGQASTSIMGRIGAFMGIFWVDNFAYDHILRGASLLIVALLVAAIMAFFLPETNGLDFDEIYPPKSDAEMVKLLHHREKQQQQQSKRPQQQDRHERSLLQ